MRSSAFKFRAVVLIDRDGTINEEVEYLSQPEQLVLLPHVTRALRILRQEGVAIIVTTNQSGIARGFFDDARLTEIHARLEQMLAQEGVRWDALYYCPAHPNKNDPRRKPAPGMYHDAVRDLGLEGLPVYSIGDRWLDAEFGINCGGKGIRVLTGQRLKEDTVYNMSSMYERRQKKQLFTAEDLFEAVHVLLADLNLGAALDDRLFQSKFADLYSTARALETERDNDNRIVLANGCFDILHGGHASYLESARALGDRLVLAINSNASVARLKGDNRPLLPETDRLELLAALRCVDYLTIFHEDSADYVLEALRPNIHAKGTDYRADNVPELETSKRLGIQTKIAGEAKENSSRNILEVVLDRHRKGQL